MILTKKGQEKYLFFAFFKNYNWNAKSPIFLVKPSYFKRIIMYISPKNHQFMVKYTIRG